VLLLLLLLFVGKPLNMMPYFDSLMLQVMAVHILEHMFGIGKNQKHENTTFCKRL
jgi:hypothetical protein